MLVDVFCSKTLTSKLGTQWRCVSDEIMAGDSRSTVLGSMSAFGDKAEIVILRDNLCCWELGGVSWRMKSIALDRQISLALVRRLNDERPTTRRDKRPNKAAQCLTSILSEAYPFPFGWCAVKPSRPVTAGSVQRHVSHCARALPASG